MSYFFKNDYFENHCLFKSVRETLSGVSRFHKNVMQCKDGILYAWDCTSSRLFALYMNDLISDQIDTHGDSSREERGLQILHPTDYPAVTVEEIYVNKINTKIVLVGSRGLAFLDLPPRWGIDKCHGSQILCKCRSLTERHLGIQGGVTFRQVKWHPGSLTDSDVVVLCSDNTFRVYSATTLQLLHVWPLCIPGFQKSQSSLQVRSSLGDIAIAFDFIPPIIEGNLDQSRNDSISSVKWPFLTMTGSGDIYFLSFSLEKTSRSSPGSVQGPLTMLPPSDDNYGVDASSLLILQSSPPVVIIATCKGAIYHSILLPRECDDDENSSSYSDNPLPSWSLHVFECVELELGLNLKEEEDLFSCPVHLISDPVHQSRYFCCHDSGIHQVVLPIVAQLKYFNLSKDKDIDQFTPSLSGSQAEYLLCTRMAGPNEDICSAVIAIAIHETPAMAIVLLQGGQWLALPLAYHRIPPLSIYPAEPSLIEDLSISRESFEDQIRTIFKSGSSQPILKFGPNANPSPQDCIELLTRTERLYRTHVFQNMKKAMMEIELRVQNLNMKKSFIIGELNRLNLSRSQLKGTAERLAERYEEVNDKQQELVKRAERVLILVSSLDTNTTDAENKIMNCLTQNEEKVQCFKRALHMVKEKQKYYQQQQDQLKAQIEKRQSYFGFIKKSALMENLSQMAQEIATLSEKVTLFNEWAKDNLFELTLTTNQSRLN